MNHVSVAKVQTISCISSHFLAFSVLCSAKTNFVLKFSSKAMAAENDLPCLLVKPLSVLVLPSVMVQPERVICCPSCQLGMTCSLTSLSVASASLSCLLFFSLSDNARQPVCRMMEPLMPNSTS